MLVQRILCRYSRKKYSNCHVNGADSIEKALVEELGIGDGETTADGLFSIKV
ncbi:MAG: NAD(P)H-dependent oxidoreductase subunit E, partial [Clostridia bacterium]|nr:NAD(P)H-dependent oxidoreductase subunit E [Clostridia bacterium]